MKLATLKDGTRDGQLVVVSHDLHTAVIADAIAPTMQRVIEDWSFYAPQLRALYDALNAGRVRRAFGFDPKHCMAPLPRAYRMLSHGGDDAESSAARTASAASRSSSSASRAAAMRADGLLGAHDDIVVDAPDVELDFRGVWAAILSDIPLRATPARAAENVRLLMLASVFATPDSEAQSSRSRAFGAQEHCAFSPVAVTPDEIGDSWQAGRLTRAPDVQVNGRRAAFALSPSPSSDDATAAGVLDWGVAVAGLVRGQGIAAGTVLLSGPATSLSSSEPANAWLGFGDRIRVDLLDRTGESICGAIEQSISPADDA